MTTDLLALSAMLADQETVTTRHYDQNRPEDAIAGSTLRRRYGSWPAAVAAAREHVRASASSAPEPSTQTAADDVPHVPARAARTSLAAAGAVASAVIGAVAWVARRRR